MTAPPWQYRLLVSVYWNNVLGYEIGSTIMQEVVDAFGLVLGVDYEVL